MKYDSPGEDLFHTDLARAQRLVTEHCGELSNEALHSVNDLARSAEQWGVEQAINAVAKMRNSIRGVSPLECNQRQLLNEAISAIREVQISKPDLEDKWQAGGEE